jgi:hypothetical protein
MKKNTYNLALGVLLRGLRGFIAGFLSVAVTITISNVTTWGDLGTTLQNIALSGTVGGITGLLLALDKSIRG